MSYEFLISIFFPLCIAGIAAGLLSYLLNSAYLLFVGHWLENIAIQTTMICVALSVVLVRMRGGDKPYFMFLFLYLVCAVAIVNFIHTTISLLSVRVVYKRFSRYVLENLDRLCMAEYLMIFHSIYDSELRLYSQMYRNIFHNLSYKLANNIKKY